MSSLGNQAPSAPYFTKNEKSQTFVLEVNTKILHQYGILSVHKQKLERAQKNSLLFLLLIEVNKKRATAFVQACAEA